MIKAEHCATEIDGNLEEIQNDFMHITRSFMALLIDDCGLNEVEADDIVMSHVTTAIAFERKSREMHKTAPQTVVLKNVKMEDYKDE